MDSIVQSRRNFKRNKVISMIRNSNIPISRFEICKMTGYSSATISDIVAKLQEDKIVLAMEDQGAAKVGRKPVYLKLNPKGGYFIGIEFNIQNSYCVILNFVGDTVYSRWEKMPTAISKEEILLIISRFVEECLEFLGSERIRVNGVGLGLPGYIDTKKGIALSYEYLEDWKDVQIKAYLEAMYDIPCYIANNVDCMALAYKFFGSNKETEDLVFISIRTGARLVPLLGGEIYFGKNGSGGELGHIPIYQNEKICTCGKKGCLNTLISDFSIEERLKEEIAKGHFNKTALMAFQRKQEISVGLLVESALLGDKESIEYIEECAKVFGWVLVTTVNLFSPDKMIISGALSKAGNIFFNPIREVIEKHCVKANVDHLQILGSDFEDNIGAIGAAALVMEEEYGINNLKI